MRESILAFLLILLFHVPAPDAQALIKQGRYVEALRILRPPASKEKTALPDEAILFLRAGHPGVVAEGAMQRARAGFMEMSPPGRPGPRRPPTRTSTP